MTFACTHGKPSSIREAHQRAIYCREDGDFEIIICAVHKLTVLSREGERLYVDAIWMIRSNYMTVYERDMVLI